MPVTTGTVVGGKRVVEDSIVTVSLHEPAGPFNLALVDENALLAAMMEIERGEFVSADELPESLPKQDYGSCCTRSYSRAAVNIRHAAGKATDIRRLPPYRQPVSIRLSLSKRQPTRHAV
jgi:hypothetical protein